MQNFCKKTNSHLESLFYNLLIVHLNNLDFIIEITTRRCLQYLTEENKSETNSVVWTQTTTRSDLTFNLCSRDFIL